MNMRTRAGQAASNEYARQRYNQKARDERGINYERISSNQKERTLAGIRRRLYGGGGDWVSGHTDPRFKTGSGDVGRGGTDRNFYKTHEQVGAGRNFTVGTRKNSQYYGGANRRVY